MSKPSPNFQEEYALNMASVAHAHSMAERLRQLTLALDEAHRVLDDAGIPSARGVVCDDSSCNSQIGHRIRLLIEPEALASTPAQPTDVVLALVNQALTKAGSRHIVGTKDGRIVSCTIDEPYCEGN